MGGKRIEALRAMALVDGLRDMANVNLGVTLGREQVRELVTYVDNLTAIVEVASALLEADGPEQADIIGRLVRMIRADG